MIEVQPGFTVLPPKARRGGSYIQTPQPKQVLFSWAKAVDENQVQQLFKMVMCRDYLGDLLWVEETGIEAQIYGFVWAPTDPKLDRDRVRLLVEPQPEDYAVMFKNLVIIHDIEFRNTWTPTRIVPSGKLILFEGDPKWMSSIPLISLYSFLIKCCAFEYKDMSKWWDELIHFDKYSGGRSNISDGPNPVSAGSEYIEKMYAQRWKNLPLVFDSLDAFADPDVCVSGWIEPQYNKNIDVVHSCSGVGSLLGKEYPTDASLKANEYAVRADKIVKAKKKK